MRIEDGFVAYNFVAHKRTSYPWTRITTVFLKHPVIGKREKVRRYELYPIRQEHCLPNYDLGRRYVHDVNISGGRSWTAHDVITDLPLSALPKGK